MQTLHARFQSSPRISRPSDQQFTSLFKSSQPMETAIGITLFAAPLVCDARATDVTKVPAYDR